jgi:predicted PurR-regulated permease PerM
MDSGMISDNDIQKRSKLFYRMIIVAALAVFITIVWALRTMIIPAVVGALLAYAFLPVLRKLKRKGLPNGLALLILLGGFVGGIVLVTEQVKEIIPDEIGKLVLRVRIQYKLTERYEWIRGEDSGFISDIIAREFEPIFAELIGVLSLNPRERELLKRHVDDNRADHPELDRYWAYDSHNEQALRRLKPTLSSVQTKPHQTPDAKVTAANQDSLLAKISHLISIWLVAPFVFLFLLVDNGEIKRNLILLVPNRYFEMTIAIIDNVDEAIGQYLRGTLMECSLVGMTFLICLVLIGIELQWALIIGMIAGVANAIPFLGPAIGLVVGVFYALIAEDMQPILPFIDPENVLIWVVVSVAIVQLLDNTVFQPIVLGSAVSLHPLVVIFGVMGGSLLFGFAGMLFAIPAIVVVKVVFSTLLHEMKAYRLIE